MLVQLRKHGADVQMSVSLDLGSLQSALNREGPLQKVESSSHFSNSTIVAGHVVESHSLSEFVIFAELL